MDECEAVTIVMYIITSHDYFSVVRVPKMFSFIKSPGYNTMLSAYSTLAN